jgi:DNA-binding transcriptional LysR family regulator
MTFIRPLDEPAPELHSRPTMRELEVFRALIASSKTTAAASALGISQPSVSRCIASLEQRMGLQLFVRDGGRLVPTAHALALEEEAARILNALDRLTVWPQAESLEGRLRIVTTTTLSQCWLARLLPEFFARERNLQVNIEIGNSTDVINTVADRAADVGLVDQPPAHVGLHYDILHDSAAHVVMRASHPLAAKDSVTAQDLADERLVALPRRFAARALTERAFQSAGVTPCIAVETATSVLAASLVKSGIGVAILNPFPLLLEADEELAFRRFVPEINYQTAAVTPAGARPSAAATRFVAFLRAQLAADQNSAVAVSSRSGSSR